MATPADRLREPDSHPDAIELVELACGEVRLAHAARLQRHCLVCDDCARQLRALVTLREVCGLSVPPDALGALQGLLSAARSH